MQYPVVNRRALGQNCPVGQFWDGTQCRSSVGPMPGGAGVPTLPAPAPAPAPAPGPASASSPAAAPPPGAAPQQNLIACINGPDLYDIYNPDMSLVARGVLNPSASYPGVQIASFPPCPVPQATGAGGLCDVPLEYLAPKNPSGPPGKPVLVCYIKDHGMTLIDLATGAPIGTHLSGACLSLLSNVTIAQDGDPRCGGPTASAAPPSVVPPATPTGTVPTQPIQQPQPPPGSMPTQPIQQPPSPQGSMPTQSAQSPGAPGVSPWPGYGSPIGVSSYAPQGIPAQRIAQPPLVPPPVRLQCANNPGPMSMDQWFESCPGVKNARGY